MDHTSLMAVSPKIVPEETRNFTIAVFNTPPVPESEDCLYLNVYAPNKRAPAGGWPVMYWLFGGALQFGSASVDQYDGAKLAANHDVIVVSGNYRTNGMPQSDDFMVSFNIDFPVP
jgi:carboxylesterase type B